MTVALAERNDRVAVEHATRLLDMAWLDDNAHDAHVKAMVALLPGRMVSTYTWADGTVAWLAGNVPRLQTNLSSITPIVRTGHLYSLGRRDRFANTPVGPALFRNIGEKGLAARDALFREMDVGAQLRTVFYDRNRVVAFVGFYTAPDDRSFQTFEALRFRAIVPLLHSRLTIAKTLGEFAGDPDAVCVAMDQFTTPAFLVTSSGYVAFANRAARAIYQRRPEALDAYRSRGAEAPSGARSVALRVGSQVMRLVTLDSWNADLRTMRSSPWAVRWKLGPRLAEVAALVMTGLTDKEIAARLRIGVETARGYVKHVLRAAGVHTRAALMHAALHPQA